MDFIDETDTLGHVAEGYSTEDSLDDAVNDYTEDEWLVFETNDIDNGYKQRGDGVWSEGDLVDHLDEIQPFVEYTMGMRDDLPGYDPEELADGLGNTPAQVRDEERPWAHKLAFGAGFGVDNVLPEVDSSLESTRTILPAIEYFARELLDRGEEVETVKIATAEPTDQHWFSHGTGMFSYTKDDGEFDHKYVEGTIGGGTPRWFNSTIRDPHDSIYAEAGINHAASALEYSRALEEIENGDLGHPSEDVPDRAALSIALASTLWSYVDVAGLGVEIDYPERNWDLTEGNQEVLYDKFGPVRGQLGTGAPVTVSPGFGQSVEQNFDNYSPEVEQQFENIGRGIQTFYEEFGYGAPLGLGGTVENPEFYKMDADAMERAWTTDYDDLSSVI